MVRRRRLQFGGTLTTIVILAVIGALGYYAWKALTDDTPPTCSAEQDSCLARCRKTATEAPAMQACQEECKTRFAACSSRQR